MEKIKSILSGHKKSEDATHDTHTSAGTHHEGETHPIYDQMKGTSSAQPTTTGAVMSAGQTGTSTGLGHTEHQGTQGTLGGHSAVADHSVRPGAPGAGNMHGGISEASIKSGVIGFGAGERQEHAALSSRQNPEANLDRNQIVGGGSMAPSATIAETSKQPSTIPVPGAATSDQSHGGIGNTGLIGSTAQSSSERQPYEQNLRQESYINDTNRSFPLAGGVAPKHDSSLSHPTEHHSTGHQALSTLPPVQQASSTSHPVTSEREPGTKERDVGVKEGHGREGLAGAAAAAAAVGVAAPLSQSHHHDQGLNTRDATYGNQPLTTSSTIPGSGTTGSTTQSHHPEALAAATAAAAKSSTMAPPTHAASSSISTSRAPEASAVDTQSHNSRYNDPGRPPGGRSISYRHVPGGFPTPTPDDSKTFLFYRDEVVPEPGVDGPVAHHVPSTRGTPYGQHQLEDRAPPVTAGTALAGDVGGSDGIHHDDAVGSGVSTGVPVTHDNGHATTAPIAGADSATAPVGQHELRHTGSLDQPQPHSAEYIDEHHHGRDAAIVGGVGAGVAGLGYAATHQGNAPEVASGNMPHETSPYSSKQLDPRVSGSKGKLEEQRFDTQAPSATATHHGLQSTAPVAAASTHQPHTETAAPESASSGPHKSSLLNKLDPRVKDGKPSTSDSTHTSTTKEKDQDHHARDAALVGGGAATAAGVHHSLQRNDTPGTGTAVLPAEESSRSAGPLSSTTAAPQHTSSTAPLHGTAPALSGQTTNASGLSGSSEFADYSSHPAATKKYEPYQGPATTSGTPFYGAHGAPAPIEASSGSHQPSSTLAATAPLPHHQDSHTPTTAPTTQPQDAQHHYGRDATLVDAGAATAGGLAHAGQHDNRTDTGPASKTIGPHSSNIANVVDPRVQPDPSKQGHHDQHHLGRDAAVVGGTGATGYGAHEAVNAYGDHRSTQPGASMNDQRYDPTASSTHASHPVPVTGHHDINNNDHTSRNVALGSGAVLGAGALGGAAYAGTRHADNTQHVPASSTQPLNSSTHAAPLTQSYPTQGSTASTYPATGTVAPQNTRNTVAGGSHAPHDSVHDTHGKDHTKRDAALLGTAGAATAGGAAYAHNQHSDLSEKEQHKLEKEQHKHEKEQEKEAHRLEKEREKEAHRLEKEREKDTSTPEKKHGILGFLHRDKSKKERTSADTSPRHSGEVRRSTDTKRHSKEYAAGGAVLGAGTTAAAYDSDSNNPNSPRWKGKNRLHKDPPKGHPARESLEHHELGEMPLSKREHVGTDGAIGDAHAISGQHETRHNVYGAEPIPQALGATKVVEPHTGLPMDVARFGDGHGGTDGNAAIHGHHDHAAAPGAGGVTGAGSTTDWAAIKKADTPY